MVLSWRSRQGSQPPQSSTVQTIQAQRHYSSSPSHKPVVAWIVSPAVQSVTCSFVQWGRVSPTSVRRWCPPCSSDNAKLSADARVTTSTSKTMPVWSWTPREKWRAPPWQVQLQRSVLSYGPESPPTLAPSSERLSRWRQACTWWRLRWKSCVMSSDEDNQSSFLIKIYAIIIL